MKKITFALLLFSTLAVAQERNLPIFRTDSLQLHADVFLGTDVLGSWYFITDNTFIKKNRGKDWQYKNPALGRIAKVDLQNSLKIVLFYESFNTAVLLDNQLNEIDRVRFSDYEVPIVATAVGLASGNRLWVYNSLTQKIGLFDYVKKEYQEISSIIKGNFKYYSSDFNDFQWIDEGSNWYRCNVYGKITMIGKVPEGEQLQLVSDTAVLYNKDGILYHFSVDSAKSTAIDFGEKSFQSFRYKDQILSIFTKQGITNYKIKLP